MNEFLANIQYSEDTVRPYKVGALLYSPANNEEIAEGVISEKFGNQYSLALCLEDSISDLAVDSAVSILINTIKIIYQEKNKRQFYIPMIFIRVRKSKQILMLYKELGDSAEILTGFIFPKFTVDISDSYLDAFLEVNSLSRNRLFMMPIMESQDIVNYQTRYDSLQGIKDKLHSVREHVLNIRVGGNDFCKGFGIRRHVNQSIYEIGCVSSILYDIITYFSQQYVVSGPVWEYFGGPNGEWKMGMQREIALDKINGLIGKTVIHPKQIEVFNHAMKVDKRDYLDALSICTMNEDKIKLVKKSAAGERMNEYKTHLKWAERTLILANIYGVEECRNEKKVIQL